MKTVHVKASKNYDVLIGSELISQLGTYLSDVKNCCKCAIISDSNVWPIYGETVVGALNKSGYDAVEYVFPAGEASKCTETYLRILNFLAQNHITRSDLIIALGGGVTGDMAGFAAATFLRGVDYVQIPTSLLAMVDSSVGGKTAIDLPAGKNLVGAFYQPIMVLCDIDTLKTLPEDVFRDGCAEVIKYGILYDQNLFAHLAQYKMNFDREAVIAQCVELKSNVVSMDEYDLGQRQMLNLGHTFGHCIEAQSGFTVTHGQAVAIGMCIISKIGVQLGLCDQNTHRHIRSILESFGLPTSTSYTSDSLITHALSDKKRTGGSINLIIPQAIGACTVRKTPVNELKQLLETGL